MPYVDVVELAYPSPRLQDDGVALRPWTLDDIDRLAEASTDPRIPAGTTVPASFTPAAGEAFVERQWSRLQRGEGISMAIHTHDGDRAVGLVVMMLRPQPGVVGLGYWIVPSARGRGYASRAATLASTWAIGPGGFSRIEAWVEPDNLTSQAVLDKAGFAQEGRLRSFLANGEARSDALVYSRIPA